MAIPRLDGVRGPIGGELANEWTAATVPAVRPIVARLLESYLSITGEDDGDLPPTVTEAVEFSCASVWLSAIFDFDKDGDLDIISSVLKLPLAAFAGLDQKIKLFANQTLAGNFVVIELVGVNGVNSDCFGCKLEVEVNGVSTIFYVDGGSGHASQSSKYIYCGIGENKFASQASVWFTDGSSFVMKKLKRRHVYRISSAGRVVKRKY
jgi:hypothetical protein